MLPSQPKLVPPQASFRLSRVLARVGSIALGCVLSSGLCLAAADDEILREFKKYFRKYKESAVRVEAIRSLEGVESPEMVKVLSPLLKDGDPEVVRAAIERLAAFETRPPVDALLTKLEKEKQEPIRVGLLRALSSGGYPDTIEIVAVCLEDKAWEVRRRAIEAIAASKHASAAALIDPLAADREPAVRLAVIEGLTRLEAEVVVSRAIEALVDEAWQVRAAAMTALSVVRSKDAIDPLIARMELEEGRLREDAGKALEAITARGFGPRVELWKQWWGSWKERYEIPTDEELEVLRKKQAERAATYKPVAGATSYHGIESPSRAMLFVIDISGSMEHEVVERDRFKDGGYPSYSRMDIVKTELARTVEGLEPYVRFNIIAFATEVKLWKKDLVAANVLNKSSAASFIKRLEPLGGTSKEDLARVGLTGSANLAAGRTNTYTALAHALGVEGKKRSRSEDYELEVDTIFFLSDGRPTDGKYTDAEELLRFVKEANDLRKTVIHTIGIGDFPPELLKRLAESNGGVYVNLGR